MERRHISKSFRSTAHARSIGGLLLRSLRPIFALIGRRLQKYRPRSAPAHLSLGRKGETIAAAYLRKNGYRVLYKNFRSKRGGEIDLVCRDCRAETLVFVEVKTRATDAFGPPHYAVTLKQQDRIIRGAKEWLRMLSDPRVSYRFDVVEVLMQPIPAVNLIRGAFQVADDIYL
jgi:putative endonuclease